MEILRVLSVSLKLNFKNLLSHRFSFWIKLILSMIKHLLFALSWKPFYAIFDNIHGWQFEHHILMIGMVTFGTGIVEVFFDGLRDLPIIIESGKLDKYLLQPKDPILMIALSKITITSWSDVLAGITLIGLSGLFDISILLFLVLAGLFFFSLYLYVGSLRFFIPGSSDLLLDIYSKTLIIASQPNVSYSSILKVLTFSVLPVCLISFLPIQYIREKQMYLLIICVMGGLCFHIVARFVFFKGIKRYEVKGL
jgi:ABC-2 type transport system permease protein